MGVNGILPRILSTAGHPIDLTDYKKGILEKDRRKRRPMRIAIDVSGWIASACHGYGSMLVNDEHLTNFGRANLVQQQQQSVDSSSGGGTDSDKNDKPSTAQHEFVTQCAVFVLQKVLHIQESCKTDVMVVLDGASPPLKRQTQRARRQRRQDAAAERDAVDQDKENHVRLKAARRAGAEDPKLYGMIVQELLLALRQRAVPFLVSPYEADGQLTYLSQCGFTDLIITNDSDLIAHGANCILYKLKEQSCRGILLQRHDLGASSLPLSDFSNAMLATMYVLAGCDYCESLAGIGIVTARNIVKLAFHGSECHESQPRIKRFKGEPVPPLKRVFEEAYKSCHNRKSLSLQQKLDYEEKFLASLAMYRHPVVFDPIRSECLFAGDPPNGSDPELVLYEPYAQLVSSMESMQQVLGQLPDPVVSTMIAEGWIHPQTKELYVDNVDMLPPDVKEMWLGYQQNEDEFGGLPDEAILAAAKDCEGPTTFTEKDAVEDADAQETETQGFEKQEAVDASNPQDIMTAQQEKEFETQEDVEEEFETQETVEEPSQQEMIAQQEEITVHEDEDMSPNELGTQPEHVKATQDGTTQEDEMQTQEDEASATMIEFATQQEETTMMPPSSNKGLERGDDGDLQDEGGVRQGTTDMEEEEEENAPHTRNNHMTESVEDGGSDDENTMDSAPDGSKGILPEEHSGLQKVTDREEQAAAGGDEAVVQKATSPTTLYDEDNNAQEASPAVASHSVGDGGDRGFQVVQGIAQFVPEQSQTSGQEENPPITHNETEVLEHNVTHEMGARVDDSRVDDDSTVEFNTQEFAMSPTSTPPQIDTPQRKYPQLDNPEPEVIDLLESDDDGESDHFETQPQHQEIAEGGSIPDQAVSHSVDLTQNSSGTSSTSRFASQPSSHPSDGSHISADVRSPNLLTSP